MLAMVSGQVFRLVRKRNGRIVVIAAFYNQALSFLLRFSRAYLYYAYGAHVPFLCTSTYRTGDTPKRLNGPFMVEQFVMR